MLRSISAFFFKETKYTDDELDGLHVTNLETTTEGATDSGLFYLHFYTLPALTQERDYVRIQIYTGIFSYRSPILSNNIRAGGISH